MGLLVLVLVVLRMAWLLRSRPAVFPGDIKKWESRLAHAVHLALYGLILAFPVSFGKAIFGRLAILSLPAAQ
jgi:cytochrome b561